MGSLKSNDEFFASVVQPSGLHSHLQEYQEDRLLLDRELEDFLVMQKLVGALDRVDYVLGGLIGKVPQAGGLQGPPVDTSNQNWSVPLSCALEDLAEAEAILLENGIPFPLKFERVVFNARLAIDQLALLHGLSGAVE